jgi:hypothetical protein
MPCPVCGHPTGDCAGETPAPTRIVGLGMLGGDNIVDNSSASDVSKNSREPRFERIGVMEQLRQVSTFLIEEDIFQEKQITPFTKARVLAYRKGEYVSLDTAKKLGLL